MKKFLYVLPVACLLLACKKDKKRSNSKVEFYLLSTYEPVAGKCEVDSTQSTLKSTPFITNNDIIQYSPSAHTFKLSSAGIQAVQNLVGRNPFAVTVDNKVVYFAYFNPPILSSSCEHSISMYIDLSSDDKIILNLGYPGLITGVPVDDQRNNPRLIEALGGQGKLR